MGYYARGYGLWKRKEKTRRTHTSQFTIACNLSNCLERVSRNDQNHFYVRKARFDLESKKTHVKNLELLHLKNNGTSKYYRTMQE